MKKEVPGVAGYLAGLVVILIIYYLFRPISEIFNISFAVVLGFSVGISVDEILSKGRIRKETIVGGIAGAIVAGITFFYLLEVGVAEIFSWALSFTLGFGIFTLSEYVVSKRKS
ncbi:MAG: hypothetical protein ACE5K0_00555 [Candidatus Methanofastidiosia archaeon]